jgi:AAA ATPase domain
VDKRSSPFAPGAGTPPLYLAGRQSLIEDFDITMHRLERGRSGTGPLITGPRGSGKTVLLNTLAARARARGWYVGRSEVIPTAPLSALIALIAHEALREMTRGNLVTEGVKRALGVLKAFTSVSAMGVSLSIDVDAVRGKADTGIFEHDLRQLIAELGQLAKSQGAGFAFVLDEVQALPVREFDALNAALHDASQRQLPVTLVSAGLFPSWQSGSSRGDPSRVTTYEARVSTNTFTRLEPLSDHDSRLALIRTGELENASFEPYALDRAVRFCEGSCWLLQLLGETVWTIADRAPIRDDAVRAAERAVDAKLASSPARTSWSAIHPAITSAKTS